jgi:hypothetical protein
MNLRFAAAFAALLVALPAAEGAIVTYANKAAFLAATGATATAPIPNIGAVPSPSTLGTLTFSLGPGGTRLFFGFDGTSMQWSSLLPGNEIAISANEDLNVDLASPAFSFGFEFHEPSIGGSATDACFVAVCTDSTFRVTALSLGVPVGSFDFNAPDDVAAFVGFASTVAFDRVEILDVTATIDDEYFGQFYTGGQAIPEPATWLTLGVALAALVARSRR